MPYTLYLLEVNDRLQAPAALPPRYRRLGGYTADLQTTAGNRTPIPHSKLSSLIVMPFTPLYY